jgi:hypothetical protein
MTRSNRSFSKALVRIARIRKLGDSTPQILDSACGDMPYKGMSYDLSFRIHL